MTLRPHFLTFISFSWDSTVLGPPFCNAEKGEHGGGAWAQRGRSVLMSSFALSTEDFLEKSK
eukprot:5939692-Pyramimonas_sp.AAC.1